MLCSIVYGMSNSSFIPAEADFASQFNPLISRTDCRRLAHAHRGSAAGAPAKLKDADWIAGLVYHVCQPSGVLSQHLQDLTGKRYGDSSISERRQTMDWPLWLAWVGRICGPLADRQQQPGAFYKGWRLVGIDGTTWSVANTPAVKRRARKTKSRRRKAAFHRLSGTVLCERGIHNPIAAHLGVDGESEMALAAALWPALQKDWLLIADRLYGVGKGVGTLSRLKNKPAWLLRARKNLKARLVETLRDGSALVTVVNPATGEKLRLREIRAKVRRRSGQWVNIRLWTHLLDAKTYPALELVQLYALRWEQEIAFKELKIDLKRESLLLSLRFAPPPRKSPRCSSPRRSSSACGCRRPTSAPRRPFTSVSSKHFRPCVPSGRSCPSSTTCCPSTPAQSSPSVSCRSLWTSNPRRDGPDPVLEKFANPSKVGRDC